MKKGLLLVLLSITVMAGSCKKNKEYCWACRVISNGDDVPEQCGKTQNDINKLQSQNGWECYKE